MGFEFDLIRKDNKQLSHNRLATLPSEMAQLTALNELYVSVVGRRRGSDFEIAFDLTSMCTVELQPVDEFAV